MILSTGVIHWYHKLLYNINKLLHVGTERSLILFFQGTALRNLKKAYYNRKAVEKPRKHAGNQRETDSTAEAHDNKLKEEMKMKKNKFKKNKRSFDSIPYPSTKVDRNPDRQRSCQKNYPGVPRLQKL